MDNEKDIKLSITNLGFSWVDSLNISYLLGDYRSEENSFISRWAALEPDGYLKSLEVFRFRRYGEFLYTCNNDQIEATDASPFYQSTEFNTYVGGVHRKYPSLSNEDKNSGLLDALIRLDLNLCGISSKNENECWKIGVHQIRILTSGNEVFPAPEGIHSDGHDFLAIHLISRENISGGKCTIYNKHQKPIEKGILLKRWDSLILNDRHLKHGISSVYPKNTNNLGFRDVLIIDLNKVN